VGFIRNLPTDLIAAFRATLEELDDADLLLHVVDASSPYCESQLEVVAGVLKSLDLSRIPVLPVFNKSDRADPVQLRNLCRRHQALPCCALEPASLRPLLERMEALVFPGHGLSAIRKPEPPARSAHPGGEA